MTGTSLLEALFFLLPFMGILTKQGLVAFYSAQSLLTTDEKRIVMTSVCIRHRGHPQWWTWASHHLPTETPQLPSSEASWAWGWGRGAGAQCAVLWVMCWRQPSLCCLCACRCCGWVFIQVELNLKTIIFIFAIKYAESQDTQETLKIK